ncbi:unnamed protein product [Protopolystoma xenopodis]|uniref:Uncharacterized protein n=1 Tax=Protopolystoma xenopodis TaxID=117903 RepID=A0A3S5ABT0_9PLAT|nr:unnamed protein product [Protopolystoma xenopodis]
MALPLRIRVKPFSSPPPTCFIVPGCQYFTSRCSTNEHLILYYSSGGPQMASKPSQRLVELVQLLQGPANETNVIRSEAVDTALPVVPNDTSQHLQASVPPSRQLRQSSSMLMTSSDPLAFSSPANWISAHSSVAAYTLREARTVQAQKFDKGPCITESKAGCHFMLTFIFIRLFYIGTIIPY